MNNQMTITLNAKQQAQFAELKRTRANVSDQDLFEQIFDRGAYDLCYRSKRNRQQWQQFKAWRQAAKQQSE
jgi:hypothetical protein